MVAGLILMLAAEAAAAVPAGLSEPDPSHMSQQQIRAFNELVPRAHPWHIRCMSTPEIGSLAKMTRICRTLDQWNRAENAGNVNARETAEAMASHAEVTESVSRGQGVSASGF